MNDTLKNEMPIAKMFVAKSQGARLRLRLRLRLVVACTLGGNSELFLAC